MEIEQLLSQGLIEKLEERSEIFFASLIVITVKNTGR